MIRTTLCNSLFPPQMSLLSDHEKRVQALWTCAAALSCAPLLWFRTPPQAFPLRLHRCGSCDQWENWVSQAGPFWPSQNLRNSGTEAAGSPSTRVGADCCSALRDSLEKIPPPLPVGLSKQNFWGMLSKLSDTSWNGIIYPPLEATSFAFLASVTLRRGLCPETRPTAAAVILARPSGPEGEEPRRVCVGGKDGCGNLPGQMGTLGPQMNLLALEPCSLFSDLAPGIWKVRCGTGLGASRQNEAGARKEVRASETYGILR